MASVIKVGGKWRAQVRRKGFPTETRTFDVKAQATAWAAKVEADMMAMKHQDTRIISNKTLGDLIDRYTEEIGAVRPFGRNKADVLGKLKVSLGDTALPQLNIDALMRHIKRRRADGAGGVTVAIDLTYLSGVLSTAKNLWRLPVNTEVVAEARANLKYMGVSTKSKERDRRPTLDELERLKRHFAEKKRQRVPMPDLIDFAVATAMRAGEIIRLQWADLNEQDRTIIIRDRKHPTEKQGNDQEVPLLGEAFAIVKRQPRHDDEPRIFPVTDGTISSIFPRACNALGIVDLTFHDLRHEGVSRLFEKGYTIEQVSLVSGHRDWKMLARYTQIRAKDLHRD
jgi:integrase